MKPYEDSFLRDEERFDELIYEYIASRPQIRAAKSRREYRFFIRGFRLWWLRHGQPAVS